MAESGDILHSVAINIGSQQREGLPSCERTNLSKPNEGCAAAGAAGQRQNQEDDKKGGRKNHADREHSTIAAHQFG